VKPHNVIVMDDDRVKVTDFGIARATGESTLTATGTIMGTAQYLSPEQASGETPGPPSDVYSMGIVLFEMLTGAVPFTGDSPVSVALRHVRDEVPAPSTIDPSIPPELDELVARATAKQPEDRFADGNAFASALTGGGTELPATAELTRETEDAAAWPFANPPRWDPNRVGKIVIAVFTVLFLVALTALGFRLASTTEPIRERNRERAASASDTPRPSVSGAPVAVTLDDYRGHPFDEVETGLTSIGLVAEPQYEECGEDEGYVCEQSPAPGETVEEGDAVTLVVSTSEGDDDEDSEDEEASGRGKKDKAPPGQAKKDEKGDD
jgi:hypothetical protein